MPETKPFSVVVEDVGGGVNEGAPSSLEDREWSALSNFHAFGTKLIRRGGLTAVSSAAYAKDLTSLFAYKQSVGSWLLLVGLKDGIGSMSGGIITQLSSPDVYPELDDPWIMRQYKDEVFACRQSTGTIKRVVPGFMHNAGIAAPLTAATISEGAAGAKEAGNRQLVYTHYVRATGAESNPSPVSNTLNLSASKKLLANGISISTNPQVDARRLYETSPNQEGEYYFVKQVDDNFTIDGIENNVAQDDLGVKASFENGMPPSGLIALEIANERLFATDGKLLYFSRPGLMQSFSEFDFIPVMEDDGHQIIDLVAWGDVLAIAKTGGMYALRGTGTTGSNIFSALVVSDKHGARGRSTQSAEGVLLWYSGENIYRSDGGSPSAISTLRVRKTLDRIPEAYKDRVVAGIMPRKSLYLLAVPLDGAQFPSHLIAYNYKTDAWDVVTPSQAPRFFGRFYDQVANEVLYGVFADKMVHEMEEGLLDGSTAITAVARTKAFHFGIGPGRKGIRAVAVNTPAVNSTLKVRVYNDEQATYVKERTLPLSGPGWKRVNISTLGSLASAHQVEFEYSGSPEFEIHGYAIEGELVPARRPRAI